MEKLKKCLVCASTCPSNSQTGGVNIKTEEYIIADDPPPPLPTSARRRQTPILLFKGETPLIQENMYGLFILQKVLKLPEDKICQLLSQNGGDFRPKSWVTLCESCEEDVLEFWDTMKQISKLERKLAEIQTELKERMERSHDDGGGGDDDQDQSSDWGHIRRDVLNICKETASVHQDFEDLTYDQSRQEIDDIDEEYKIRLEPVDEDHPDKQGSSAAAPGNRKPYFYNCPLCPFTSTSKTKGLEAHLKVHKSDADSVSCPDCGCHVLSENLTRHRSSAHNVRSLKWRSGSLVIPSIFKSKLSGRSDSQQPLATASSSGDNNDGVIRRDKKAYYLYCPQCPYRSSSGARFKSHSQVHEKGSGATACLDCGWFVLPGQLKRHRGQFHRRYHSQMEKKDG